ncbi:hypothetical protein D3C76_514090 [compost metagenome]
MQDGFQFLLGSIVRGEVAQAAATSIEQQAHGVFFVLAAGCLASSLLSLLSLKLLAKIAQTPLLEHAVLVHDPQEIGHRLDDRWSFVSLIQPMKQSRFVIDDILGNEHIGRGVTHRWAPFTGDLVIGSVRHTADAKCSFDEGFTRIDRRSTLELVNSFGNWQIPPIADEHLGAGALANRRDEASRNHLRAIQHPLHTDRHTVAFHMSCEFALAGAKAVINGFDQSGFTGTGGTGKNVHLTQPQIKDANPPAFADEKDV